MKILFIFIVFLQGCSIPYLAHVSKGQLQILNQRKKIEKVLEEGKLTPKQKNKLKTILDIKDFATKKLHLSSGDNYTHFVDLKRENLAYNLVVCPKDALKPYTWWFPFSGRVEYLGFFEKEYALETQKEYAEDGYDTYLRGVSAYSTLGWFNDPIFSTMLKYSEESLANLIIHELTHGTIYKKGDTVFNEGVATFIGNKGTLEFIASKHGRFSRIFRKALANQYDELLFSKFIDKEIKNLNLFYKDCIHKYCNREKEFQNIKKRFKKIKFKTDSYDYFKKLPLNNAVLIGFGQYQQGLEILEEVWVKNKKDLRQTIEFLKRVQDEDDPMKFLRNWSNK